MEHYEFVEVAAYCCANAMVADCVVDVGGAEAEQEGSPSEVGVFGVAEI